MFKTESVKTGDRELDRRINDAVLLSREIYNQKDFSWRQRALLKALFKALIGFRVSNQMGLEKQKERYHRQIDHFYDLLLKTGMQEKRVVDLIKKVREKFTD